MESCEYFQCLNENVINLDNLNNTETIVMYHFPLAAVIVLNIYYYMYWFFVFFILIPVSFCFTVVIIANYIYEPMIIFSDSTQIKFEDDEYDETDYVYKYFEDLDKLSERNLSNNELNDLKNKIINEKTPRGDIILYYNNETETFFYYCNTKEIPYQYLEVVARHYVCIHDCKNIYYDHDDNQLRNKKVNLDQKEKEEEVEKEKEKENDVPLPRKSIFASFMSYNTGNVKIKKETEKKVNRYTYKGKIEDYDKDKAENSNDEEIVEVDFNSFKKMMQNASGRDSTTKLDVSCQTDTTFQPDNTNIEDNSWQSWLWTDKKNV